MTSSCHLTFWPSNYDSSDSLSTLISLEHIATMTLGYYLSTAKRKRKNEKMNTEDN